MKTSVLEMLEILPAFLLKKFGFSNTGKQGHFNAVFHNGHTMFAKVLKNEGSLRSLNLSAA